MLDPTRELGGKIALVTGAGGDLGRVIAQRLFQSGARIMITDINRDNAQRTRALIGDDPDAVFDVDITKRDAVQKMVEDIVTRHGKLEILVNNAGDIRDAWLPEMRETDWRYVIDLNLKGSFLCAQAASIPMIRQKSGKIINISSMSYKGNIGQVNYPSAKAGSVGMTGSLGIELARYGITVNCVAPGIIDTPKAKTLSAENRDRLIRLAPMRRMGDIVDIANAVHFFASEQSNYIKRQVIHVSGSMEGF